MKAGNTGLLGGVPVPPVPSGGGVVSPVLPVPPGSPTTGVVPLPGSVTRLPVGFVSAASSRVRDSSNSTDGFGRRYGGRARRRSGRGSQERSNRVKDMRTPPTG